MNSENIKSKRGIASLLLLMSSTCTVQALEVTSSTGGETTWAAMFGFASVGILSLAFSSYRFKRAAVKHQEMLQLKEDMDVKHQVILESMTQNIEVSAKGIRRYKEVLQGNDIKMISEDVFKEEMHRFEENETLLLDTTHELIDFLKIKSGNLEIVEESYKLENMLNEMYSLISSHVIENKTELLYDILPDVATSLQGDCKRIEQVLRTFLIDIFRDSPNSLVILKVSIGNESKNRIRFEFHNDDKKMLDEEIEAFLSSYTINEDFKTKEKLDLYVAYELVKKMNGSLDVKSDDTDGTTYTIELPYNPIKNNPLKSEKSVDKRLLILEDDAHRAQVLSKIFQQHDLDIDCADSQSLVSYMPDFTSYDMVIVNTKMLFLTIVEKLEKAKKEKPLLVVESYNSFEKRYADKSGGLVDASIQKPLQNEQVYMLLEKIFDTNSDEDIQEAKSDTFTALAKVERINTESFAKFAHTHVLIVEDNMMNQKILRGVLRSSGMNITMVNNGKEAVEQLEENKNFDLVLMDTNMPVMDGYDATKIIRKKYDKKQLPIIAISAVGFEDDISKMQTAGANTYLHKPFQLGELYSAFSMFGIKSQLKIEKENKEILNRDKGTQYANSDVINKELLQEVLVNLNEIDEFDLVLMDTNMSLMERYEENEKELPMTSISTVGFSDDISKMQNVGANSYLDERYSDLSLFGTKSKLKVTKETKQKSKYITNKEVLNIEKGIHHANSEVIYKELLQEVLVSLNEIDASVAKWIRKRNDKKTKEFIPHALKLAETIGASSYEKILKEIQQLFVDKKENRLEEYLPLYKNEWKILSQEIEGYRKS